MVVLAERDDCRELAARWDAMNWRDYKMDDFEKKFQYKRAGPSEEKDEESDEESKNTPGYLPRGCGPFFFGPLRRRPAGVNAHKNRQSSFKAARKPSAHQAANSESGGEGRLSTDSSVV